jgi:ABC-2 type transport system permease protein
MPRFSLHRFWAVVLKEFIQMMRDRVTFGIMVGIPLMQLLLFGFAINSDPKHLPTALRAADQGPFARSFVAALRQSDYFTLAREPATDAEAQRCSNSAMCSSSSTSPRISRASSCAASARPC